MLQTCAILISHFAKIEKRAERGASSFNFLLQFKMKNN